MSGKIIVFSGFSGVGKNTIINALRSKYPSLLYIPSMTTRKMRTGESEGFPYFFVTKEEFRNRIEKDYFIEYEEVHENWYGTPKDKYYDAIQNNHIVVKDIDVNGALSMKEEFGRSAILVYIEPPSIDELKERLVSRGDDNDDIIRRLKRVDYELSKKPSFDESVVNADLTEAIDACDAILLKYTGEISPTTHVVRTAELIPTKEINKENMEKIQAIKNAVLTGSKIPLPAIYVENNKKYIIDGHQRILGYYAAGQETLEVDVVSQEETEGKIPSSSSASSVWKELLDNLKAK